MKHRHLPYILLAAVCLMLFFCRLGGVPLIGLDEAMYAESSREMLASGDYIVPTYNGERFFDKPPLVYWMQCLGMRVFGVNSLGARLPSAVAGLLLVGLTVFLGAKLFDGRAGLFAGFALACSILTTALARMAILDMTFALTITAALGAFIMAYLGLWPRWGYLAFWAAMGLSVMVKGPAGAVLILAPVGVFVLLRRCLTSPPTPPLKREGGALVHVLGIALFSVIVAPWYVLVQRETGGAFLREFIFHQNIQRAVGKDFHHNQPFFFYILVYGLTFFPWVASVPAAWKRLVKKTNPAALFVGVWMAVVFGIFSAIPSKLFGYIFPMYPASALLVGAWWAGEVERAPSALRRPALMAAGSFAFLIALTQFGLPIASKSMAEPTVALARRVTSLAAKTEPVIAYNLPSSTAALPFYARRTVVVKKERRELAGAVRSAGGSVVVAPEGMKDELPSGGTRVATEGEFVIIRYE